MLTEKQLDEIKVLQDACEKEDTIRLKLNWDMLKMREVNKKTDFFFYEGNTLVGFAAIYGFGSKVELCGMVHPAHRRQGIFTQLFNEALTEMKKQNFRQILLNAPADSDSAKEFLRNLPIDYHVTEFQMKWNGTELDKNADVILRKAEDDDIDLEIKLEVECFGFTFEEATNFNRYLKKDVGEEFYIIVADNTAVGKVRISHSNGEAWIYGFAVLPAHQGKGIGRKALANMVNHEQRRGYPVFLEVEAKNAHALRLYESCGFRTYHAQDYYVYKGE